jgi:hypothetical protein
MHTNDELKYVVTGHVPSILQKEVEDLQRLTGVDEDVTKPSSLSNREFTYIRKGLICIPPSRPTIV